MVKLEYFNGKEWVSAGGPFYAEWLAWLSLGDDNLNYRTVEISTGKVITDKSITEGENNGRSMNF